MAFNLILYNNSADKTTVDKTSSLTNAQTISGTLREETSVVRPSFTITSASMPTRNYAYVATWNRYYYITNITSIRNGLWQLDMSVDVLMSFKSKFLPLYAYVARSQSNYDFRIPDNTYPQYGNYNQFVVTDNKLSVIEGEWNVDFDDMDYLVQCQGVLEYQISDSGTTTIRDLTLPLPTIVMNYDGVLLVVDRLNKGYAQSKNAAQYINKIYALPCSPTLDDAGNEINLIDFPGYGSFKWTVLSATMGLQPADIYAWTGFSVDLTDYINANAVYMNLKPYATFSLEFLPFGVIDIPPEYIIRSLSSGQYHLYFYVRTNVLTGDAALYFNSAPYYQTADYIASANVAIDYPYTSEAHQINVLNHLANIGTIVGGVATKNFQATMQGVAAEANEIQNSMTPITKISNGLNNFVQTPRIIVRKQMQTTTYNTSANAVYGRPLYNWVLLNGLHGYCQVEKIHLDGLDNATIDEIEEIESLLKGGVILPAASEE